MDIQKTLEFMNSLCEAADECQQSGDIAGVNRIMANPAAAHYYTNVHKLQSVMAEAWPHYYPQHANEADRLRAEYELAEEQATHGGRLEELEAQNNVLSEKLDALTAMVAKLVESKDTAAEVPAEEPAEEEADAEQDAEPAGDEPEGADDDAATEDAE